MGRQWRQGWVGLGLEAVANGGRKMGQQLGKGDGGMGLGSARVEEERKKSEGERVRLK